MEDIKRKQEYLKSEIVDKNYDQDKFIDFIITKKENGSDLANWSLEELKKLIAEFKDVPGNKSDVQSFIEKNDKASVIGTGDPSYNKLPKFTPKSTKGNLIDLEKLSSLIDDVVSSLIKARS